MSELVNWVLREKSTIPACGNDAVKLALATAWFVVDYWTTYLNS